MHQESMKARGDGARRWNEASIALWFSGFELTDDAEAAALGCDCAACDITTLWISAGGVDNRALPRFGALLRANAAVQVATAVANIWAQPAAELAGWASQLRAAHGPRLLLGVGVSHAPTVTESGLGLYQRPYATLSSYLDGLVATGFPSSAVVVGAQGPAMLRMAASRTAGAHPYLVTPDHTAEARGHLRRALLVPEQTVVLERSASTARTIGRQFLATYLKLPNYVNSWGRLGFTEADLTDGGSDRFVDQVIAWGSPDDVAERVRAHLAAGANQVALRFLGPRAEQLEGYQSVRARL
jgi:probable F420-dependent oxidoreductase